MFHLDKQKKPLNDARLLVQGEKGRLGTYADCAGNKTGCFLRSHPYCSLWDSRASHDLKRFKKRKNKSTTTVFLRIKFLCLPSPSHAGISTSRNRKFITREIWEQSCN
ncbi:hypothetical protein CEXT_478601 [Caerostris extrusa]|uniref:Uncharacterized protein n=1 Tax=Caerostris extrusa TaxID=172846 RepID=A0AAV4XXR7_CAEEX|nr:hypothetical protein CEXT_478601 [Caerostris extrusa]